MFKVVTQVLTASVLGLSLLLTGGIGANAATDPVIPNPEDYTTIEELQQLEVELVNDLRALPADASIDTAIDSFLAEHPIKPKPKVEEPGPDLMPGVDPSEYSDPDQPFDVPAYIDEEIEGGDFRAYTINDTTDLIFTDDYTFFKQDREEGPEEIVTAPEGTFTVAATMKTKHASTSYAAYSWVGLKLWSGYTSGWFNYNGSTVTAKHDSSYIKKATLSIWQVENYRYGPTNIHSNLAEVFCRANVSWGYKVGDVGLNVQDKYFKLYVRSNNDGVVTKHRTIQ